MAKPLPVHIDLMLVVGFEDQPDLNVEHIVAAYKRPRAAARQYLALECWAFEASGVERCDTPNAIGRVAENRNFKIEFDREKKLSLDLGHGVSRKRAATDDKLRIPRLRATAD